MSDNITYKAEVSQNIILKTLLLKGEAGSSILSIEKTSTVGLVDTYTITLTDGTTTTFEVANGSGIQSIVKTSTNVLVDTYTITMTNGDTSFFTVTNGRGIVSVEKTATVGKIDTYTITYNDNTTSTFTITNGMDYTVPTNGVIAYDGNDTPEGYEDYTGLVGAGHVIENQAGTELTQRPYMQFLDATPSDDSTNEITQIEVIKEITESQLSSAPDGIYRITNLGDGIITAEDVAYSQSQNVKQKIDEMETSTGVTLTSTSAKYTFLNSSIATSKYDVRGGICIVSLSMLVVTPSTSSEIINSSLPASEYNTAPVPQPTDYELNDTSLRVLYQSGHLYARGGVAGHSYNVSFSYPIA